MQAAILDVVMGGEETGLGESLPRSPGFRNQMDLLAIEGRLAGVGLLIVRGEVLRGDFACGVQRGVEHVAVMVGIAFALQQGFGVEQLVEQEAQFTFIEQVSHGATSMVSSARRKSAGSGTGRRVTRST